MGFNAYPALSIKSPNLSQVLLTAAQLKSVGLKNRLMQSKMDREKTLAGLRGEIFGSAANGEISERGALGATVDEVPAANGVTAFEALDLHGGPTHEAQDALLPNPNRGSQNGINSPAMRKYLAVDPEGGTKIIDAISKMNKEQRDQLQERNAKTAQLLMTVEDAPPEQRPMVYAQALAHARQMGLPTDNAPARYDPQWMQRQIALGMGIDDQLKERAADRKALADGVWVVGQDGKRKFVRKDELVEQSAGGDMRPYEKDLKPVLVGDETSPTGSRYVNPADAVGKPGVPKGGLNLEFDPATGRVTKITTGSKGGKGGSSELTKPTQNLIQKQLFQTTEALARLDSINRTFQSKFLEIGPRFNAVTTALKEKLGFKPSEADQKALGEFSEFKRNSIENVNTAIRDFTGAQMGVEEADRLTGMVPSAGTGLFDGDSPTEFQSKMQAVTRSLRLAGARYAHALKNGLDPVNSGISIDGMEDILRERQDAIIREARGRNPNIDDEELRAVVVQRLGSEFGLTFGK